MSETMNLPVAQTIDALIEKFGKAEESRIRGGVERVAERWLERDGDANAFQQFCLDFFLPSGPEYTRLLDRLEIFNKTVFGHLLEIMRDVTRWSDLKGDIMPGFDEMFAGFNPAPGVEEQLYKQKIAFTILLNFEPPTLDEMNAGENWSHEQWAAARLTRQLPRRVNAEVNTKVHEMYQERSRFVERCEIYVGSMVDEDGSRMFKAGDHLQPHWKTRDEIILSFGKPEELKRQRALRECMERFIEGTIPNVVLEKDADADWDPAANTIDGKPVAEADMAGTLRYDHWLEIFHAEQMFDEINPDYPTAISRSWDLGREIPDSRVEQILIELLSSPVRKSLSKLLSNKLGRPLEPHDIYFHSPFVAASLDVVNEAVMKRFSGIEDFGKQVPQVLREIGFSDKDADFFASKIWIEQGRGSGHCCSTGLPEYNSWVRTGLQRNMFNSGAYGTAMHELGHAMEQQVSIRYTPRYLLRGVPGACACESAANIICNQRYKILGIEPKGDEVTELERMAVEQMLAACQMGGAALLDLRTWHWMYANPTATPADLREAVLKIARDLWNEYYEPYLGGKDCCLLAAYQHMISYPLYIGNYVLSSLAEYQLQAALEGKDVAKEFVRVCSIGNLTPDLWMKEAVGQPLSAQPTIDAVAAILSRLGY